MYVPSYVVELANERTRTFIHTINGGKKGEYLCRPTFVSGSFCSTLGGHAG